MSERRIVDIGPLLEDLKKELEDLEGATEVLTVEEAAEDEIEELKKLPVIDPQKMIPAWRDPDKDPPKEEDGDCCGRVLIAHAGAHCAVATSLQYARENPEAVRVWMPLPKLPWEEKK